MEYARTDDIKSHNVNSPKKKKIVLIVSIVLTFLLGIEISVYAWFSSQRRMAVLGNINAPYTLYLSAANQESLVYLDMSSIDVGVPGSRTTTHKDFVFSVQGSWDISEYYLQLAHTTNIPFQYTVYRVKNGDIYTESDYSGLSDDLKETSVSYTTHTKNGNFAKGQTIYYTFRENSVYTYTGEQYGKVMDESNYKNLSGQLAVKDSSNTYYKQTYDSTLINKVQKNAVPLYMQAGPLKKNAATPRGQDFCDYYILRVEWEYDAQLRNDKETDMVYITVVSPSLVKSGS